MSDPRLEANRKSWDMRVHAHVDSPTYNVAAFRAGGSTLKSLEVEELGDVAGKRMLHLQCHFGLDSLSWARRGAVVTGVDFSPVAIEQAKALANETELEAEFICANVLELEKHLQGEFDIVFTSYGVLCWLGDLERWAQVIRHFVRPGGVFYIAEGHPLCEAFDYEKTEPLRFERSYFETEPGRHDLSGTYASTTARFEGAVGYEWQHTLGQVVTVLCGVGLHIRYVHEFPYTFWHAFRCLERHDDGWWHVPKDQPAVPLMFSLMADRPVAD